ncbi:MAG TPA: septation protein A [Acidiferrobacteraceae bacterium]|nr:septation protein A [Acidiferrobacteraceae bacterium]
MKLLYDFFPLIFFFGTFKLYGLYGDPADAIYAATAVGIIASIIQVGFFWHKNNRVETVHIITLVIITVFGGLTLLLHDDTFIKWKPTIINWVFTVILVGSQLLGKKPAIQYVMGSQLQLPDPIWQRLNLAWGIFFLLVGALNLYVAFWYRLDLDIAARQALWVDFKVFGLLGLTLVFAVGQAFFLTRYMDTENLEDKT